MGPGLLLSVTTFPAGGLHRPTLRHMDTSFQANKCICAFACAVPFAFNACPFLQLGLLSSQDYGQVSCLESPLNCAELLGCPSIMSHATWVTLFMVCPPPLRAGPTPGSTTCAARHVGGREKPGPRVGCPVLAGGCACAAQGSQGGVWALFPNRKMPCVRIPGRRLLQSREAFPQAKSRLGAEEAFEDSQRRGRYLTSVSGVPEIKATWAGGPVRFKPGYQGQWQSLLPGGGCPMLPVHLGGA